MKDYAAMFTKPVRRRSEISSLLHSIGSAIIADVTAAMQVAKSDPKEAIMLLNEINISFHELFIKIRWADGYKDMADVRFELNDIQKIINDSRADFTTMASIYMNENNNAL